MNGTEEEITPVHRPVLLNEVVEGLRITPGESYIDATLGQAGHALEIARRGGHVLGIEANPKSFEWIKRFLSVQRENLQGSLKIVLGNFINIDQIAHEHGFREVSGVLFDLGLSTFELKDGGLGLSYLVNEPLDMRFNQKQQTETAADLVNRSDDRELYRIITKYGEERDAHKIVGAIIKGRRSGKIEKTFDLVSLIDSVYQLKGSKEERRNLNNHRAKVFQALRIAVNQELENLQVVLPKALNLTRSGGRICAISFHSLEDRAVKNYFRESQLSGRGKQLTGRPLTPGTLELEENYSARSAKLRIFEKYEN